MVTDSARAERIYRDMHLMNSRIPLRSKDKIRVGILKAGIAAIRKERDAEWSAAARKAKEFADRVARSQVDKGFNKRYGMAPITEAMNIRDALNALIEEVK